MEKYIAAEIELIRIENADIITESLCIEDEGDDELPPIVIG